MFQKLFTAKQIKEIDRQTIIRQNISSEALMERAATNLFKELIKSIKSGQNIYIFSGK
jgi:NAD(P)H-hydrate repair Nnr-like enzyme with NAD(P)H-hydrate epimerase domain